MVRSRLERAWIGGVLAIGALVVLTTCATHHDSGGDVRSGLALSYRVSPDRPLRYRTTVEQTQSMRAMGRTRSYGFTRTTEFSMRSEGTTNDGELALQITVERLMVDMATPRGEMKREIGEIEGHSFGMNLSPLGHETFPAETEKLRYELPPLGSQEVALEFRDLFPDMAGRPVRIGESWTSSTTIVDSRFHDEREVELKVVSTLVGLETVDGIECAKVTSKIRGALPDDGGPPGAAPPAPEAVTGTSVWYFDYRKRTLVRLETTTTASGLMSTSGPGGPPMTTTERTSTRIELLH